MSKEASQYLRERFADTEDRFMFNGRRKSASFSEIDDIKQSRNSTIYHDDSLMNNLYSGSTMKLTQRNSSSETKVPQIVIEGTNDEKVLDKQNELEKLAGETDEDAQIRLSALQSRSSRCRSSTVVIIPNASIQMDLHTLYMGSIKNSRKGKTLEDSNKKNDEDNDKKSGRFAALMNVFKRDGNNNIGTEDFRDFLEYIRRNLIECEPHELSIYKDSHWSAIMQSKESVNMQCMSDAERRRFEALWELFHAEVTYLIDHLLVLQNVFAKSYEHARAFGFLQSMDEVMLFANLEKLIEVTSYFAKNLLKIFTSSRVSITSSTEVIATVFQEFDAVLTPEYYEYCVNYRRAKEHLVTLKEDDVFLGLTRWCEQHEFANRLHLEDFLVAPLQHLTKYPLLLKAIRKHTPKNENNSSKILTETIKNIEQSIGSTEKKISVVMNDERLEQIREAILWPAFVENEQKHPLPDVVKADLQGCSCESVFLTSKRKLLKEGLLILIDNNKTDIYTFLFDDMILLTKLKKGKIRRNTGSTDEKQLIYGEPIGNRVKEKKSKNDQNEQIFYHVYRQPIPIDRLKLYDIAENSSSSLKNCFCCVHLSRYKQLVHAYTFQASSIEEKHLWMKSLNQTLVQPTAKRAPSSGYASDEG